MIVSATMSLAFQAGNATVAAPKQAHDAGVLVAPGVAAGDLVVADSVGTIVRI